MAASVKLVKHIIIHLGPHKTGTTSIQQCLAANQDTLKRAGLSYLHSDAIHEVGLHIAKESYDQANYLLANIAQQITRSDDAQIILSQEDLCGDLPGRSRRKVVYPKLTKNLRILARALSPHRVTFVFFQRNEAKWMESCYHQHLAHRTYFSSFASFRDHFCNFSGWEALLQKPKATFKEAFKVVNYSSDPGAGLAELLEIAGLTGTALPHLPEVKNASPSPDKIRQLERINAHSAFKSTAWFAKRLVLQDWAPRSPDVGPSKPGNRSDSLARIALPALMRRAVTRFNAQEIEDILPERDVDLRPYVYDVIPLEVELTTNSRAEMINQSRILDYHFRGKSRLAKLNGLTISYLRRDTAYTDKARHLFHRVWEEHGRLLVNELSSRWLISTLQTFLDHGQNEAQRIIGACGYFYGNMMKIYEGERAIEGREQDAIYAGSTPQTQNRFFGLDRFELGGTDLLLNTNALALDYAMRDDTAGLVMQEFLLRTKDSGNVFTRMDRSRKALQIHTEGFFDTWSFFEALT